jgi:predicted transcriptional regulator
MDEHRRPPGTLEQEVLAILAGELGPQTPAQVRRAMGERLAYTTVMTVLTRLYEKGLVARTPVGRAYAYSYVTDGAGLAARQMGQLLDGVGDRSAVLSRFVDGLSPADEKLLSELLRRSVERLQ